MNIGKTKVSPLIFVGEAFVIDTEKVKNGCVKIVNMNRILSNVVTVVVRRSVGGSRLAPAASHPHRETAPVMVPSEVAGIESPLAVTCATEFATPDDKGIIQ